MIRENIEVLISVAYRAGWKDGQDGKDLPTLKELDEMVAGIYDRATEGKPKGEWIEWRTDKPDRDGWYLATYDGDVYGKDGERAVGMACFENGEWIEDTVYAWTDGPRPYEESEETK